MARIIIVVRHGKKDGENIAADQIEQIINNGIPAIDQNLERGHIIIVHPGSKLIRTQQTIQALEDYWTSIGKQFMGHNDDMGFFLPEDRFGSEELFNRCMIAKPAFKGNWMTALQETDLALLKEIQNDAQMALLDIFFKMENAETVVMAGHTPILEILAASIDPTVDTSPLKELSGYLFRQAEECGPVTVKRI
jgi:hypothetical protein